MVPIRAYGIVFINRLNIVFNFNKLAALGRHQISLGDIVRLIVEEPVRISAPSHALHLDPIV